MKRPAGLLVALALLLAACGQGETPGSAATATTAQQAPPGGVLLQIDHYGGFTATQRSRWLDLAVTDDGYLVLPQQAIPAIDPPFLYEGLQQVKPDATRLAELLKQAGTVVRDGENFTDMHVADASTTRVRWWDGTRYRTTTAYALGMDDGSGTAELAGFVKSAQDLAQSVVGAVGTEERLPASLEVWSVPAEPGAEGVGNAVVWPGNTKLSAVPPTSTSGPGTPRCHVETDVTAILPAVRKASVRTRWKDEGAAKTWTLDVVPLLAGERGCGDDLRK